MNKIIKIAEVERCIECPHYCFYKCFKTDNEDNNIEYPKGDIPEWCPLPDKQQVI